MCRYGNKTYKPHFACFNCRKSFKKTPIEDYLKQKNKFEAYKKLSIKQNNPNVVKQLEQKFETSLSTLKEMYLNDISTCPDCGNEMADLGLDFKAPKKNAVKAWKRIEGMYHVGHCFHTCGCSGFGYVPRDKTEYLQYLSNRLEQYQSIVATESSKIGPKDMGKSETIDYWSDKIKKVQKEIQKTL